LMAAEVRPEGVSGGPASHWVKPRPAVTRLRAPGGSERSAQRGDPQSLQSCYHRRSPL